MFLATELLLAACANPYLRARRADEGDILTASVSDPALAVKVRAWPLAAGLYGGMADEGWRGGSRVSGWAQKQPASFDVCFVVWGSESLDPPALARPGKSFASQTVLPFVQWPRPATPDGKFPLPYLTQVEVNLALGKGLRLGVNPGELFDFPLGWLAIDLFGDDFEPSPPNPPAQISAPGSSQPPERVSSPCRDVFGR